MTVRHLRPELDPDGTLEDAKGHYMDVLIIGWNKEEALECRATSTWGMSDMLWAMEQFKMMMLLGQAGEDEDD